MVLLIPFFIQALAAIFILVIRRMNVNLGRIWLSAVLLSLLNWGIILAYRWLLPLNFSITNWFPFADFFIDGIQFNLDAISWPLVFALASLQLAIILTDSARLEELPSANIWAGIFTLNTIGMVSVLSGSLLTVLLLWSLVDLVELFVILYTVKNDQLINLGVVSFAVKLTGTIFFVLAILQGQTFDMLLAPETLSSGVGLIMLVSIGLRLGVLPFNLPYSREIPLRIGLGNTIRMVGAASSLIVLLRIIPRLESIPNLRLLLFIAMLAAFVAALMWLVSKDELTGRPFWVIALSSFAIFSALAGEPLSALIWSLNLILTGSVLFLFSDRDRRVLFLPLIALVTLSGLPFTPSASGWLALVGKDAPFLGFINVITMSLLVLGFLRHVLRPSNDLLKNEKWIWVIFPAGLFFLLLTFWLIFLLSPFQLLQVGVAWASILTFIFPLIFYVIFRRLTALARYSDWLISLLKRMGDLLISILGLGWFYRGLWQVFNFIQSIFNLLSNLLESQSGIIWVIILIAAFISILRPLGSP